MIHKQTGLEKRWDTSSPAFRPSITEPFTKHSHYLRKHRHKRQKNYQKMKVATASILLLRIAVSSANNDDRFNYRGTEGKDFGPEHWNRVQCDDVGECLGWPDGWDLGVGWELDRNNCEWCPEGSENDCGVHRQSPINLERSRSTTGHDPECYDYHWMVRIVLIVCITIDLGWF